MIKEKENEARLLKVMVERNWTDKETELQVGLSAVEKVCQNGEFSSGAFLWEGTDSQTQGPPSSDGADSVDDQKGLQAFFRSFSTTYIR